MQMPNILVTCLYPINPVIVWHFFVLCVWSLRVVACFDSKMREVCITFWFDEALSLWKEGSISKHGWKVAWIAYENAMLKVKIITVKQLVSRSIWILAMVLVSYGTNVNKLRVWERVVCTVRLLIATFLIRGYYLQGTNFLSLGDKRSVIVSAFITCPCFGKAGIDQTRDVFCPHMTPLFSGPLK